MDGRRPQNPAYRPTRSPIPSRSPGFGTWSVAGLGYGVWWGPAGAHRDRDRGAVRAAGRQRVRGLGDVQAVGVDRVTRADRELPGRSPNVRMDRRRTQESVRRGAAEAERVGLAPGRQGHEGAQGRVRARPVARTP